MNDVNLTLLRQDIKNGTENDSDLSFCLPKKSWLKRHRNGISGIACLAAAVLLPTLMLIEMKQASPTPHNLGITTVTIVLALYCLSKGIFTLLFQAKETEFGSSVHQYLITNAYNQLYFVYERLVWLWGLLPLLLTTTPFSFGWNDCMSYWIIAASIYVVAVLSLSRPLWRRTKQIKEEIRQLSK